MANDRIDLREKILQKIFQNRDINNPDVDGPLLIACYMGIQAGAALNEELMEFKKDFEVAGYKFSVGIIDQTSYIVGLLAMSTLKNFYADELRNYRYALFQAQAEIRKAQNDIDRVLKESMLD